MFFQRPDMPPAEDIGSCGAGGSGICPVALSVAGSDSGGGAGIQADLAAFAYFNVFGTTAITAVTAQNPHTVTGICAVDTDTVCAQMEAVFDAFAVCAVKTGMLFSAEIIRAVAEVLGVRASIPVVVDPVMVSTSGARLLREDAVRVLVDSLLPLAGVVTPNLPEAEILCGRPLRGQQDVLDAAGEMARRFGAVFVIKGGHDDCSEAVDTVSDGVCTWQMISPRVAARTTHGTGCSLSAAVAACIARGDDTAAALRNAKAYVLARLNHALRVGEHTWAMVPPPELATPDIRIESC
jgi:hydroxymethylpyrimidine/phosphomethylpyrimidine kinase